MDAKKIRDLSTEEIIKKIEDNKEDNIDIQKEVIETDYKENKQDFSEMYSKTFGTVIEIYLCSTKEKRSGIF